MGRNPRGSAPYRKLEELANSLQEQGQAHPLLVRIHPTEPNKWLLIAGYRRYAAAQKLDWETIEVKVKNVDDLDADLLGLTENAQRDDVDPYIEAEEWQRILDTHAINQAELARRLGISEASVSLRLKTLRESTSALRGAVQEGIVTFTLAREMCGLPEQMQNEMLENLRKKNALGQKPSNAELHRSIEDRKHQHTSEKVAEILTKDEDIAARVEEIKKKAQKAHPRAPKELIDQYGIMLRKQQRSKNETSKFRIACWQQALEWALGIRPSI